MPARATLGRKIPAARRAARNAPRLCIACGLYKPADDFFMGKRVRALGLICRQCRDEDKEIEGKCLQPPLSKLSLYRPQIIQFLRRLAHRRIMRGKEVRNPLGKVMTPEEYAVKVAKLPERIAAIVGKTYAEKGDVWDDEKDLCDSEAVMAIRDLILEIDETLIARNKHKRLTFHSR